MDKNGLEFGMIVKLQNGAIALVSCDTKGRVLDYVNGWNSTPLCEYANGLTHAMSSMNIVEVYSKNRNGARTTLLNTCDRTLLWERKKIVPHLERQGSDYGVIGKKSNITALFGEELFVGDVVEIYNMDSGEKSLQYVIDDGYDIGVMTIHQSSKNMKNGVFDQLHYQVRKYYGFQQLSNNEEHNYIKAILK